MKTFLLSVFALLIANCSFSQPFESEFDKSTYVHVITGISQYCGDLQLGQSNLQNSKPIFGLGIQKYLKNKLSIRGEIVYTNLAGDDKTSNEKYRLKRNLNFSTKLLDASVLVQYDLFGLETDRKIIPYIFAGGGVFHYNPYTVNNCGQTVSVVEQNIENTTFQLTQFNVALGGGLRLNLSDNFKFGIELNYKVLFNDYLDGVSTRGFTPQNDAYYFAATHFSINIDAFRGRQFNYFKY
jgi:opacity protein-like surface antigen